MSELDISIRQAIPTDAKQLMEVMSLLNQETPYLVVSPHALNMPVSSMEKEVDYIYQQDNQLILLALNHEEIIGIATLVSQEDKSFEHIGEVGITIKKDYWGIGLGTIMLEEIIELAKASTTTKRLEINVQKRNTRAFSLYEKVGFSIDGIKEKGILSEDNELIDVIMMSYLI